MNSAIEEAMNLLTLVVVLASLFQPGPKAGSTIFWQDVAQLQKALAARTTFVGSPAFVGLVLMQVLLTILICQGSSTDFTSIALAFEVLVSALAISLVVGLYQVTTDALANASGFGAPLALFPRKRMHQQASWLTSVPLPPPRNS